MKILAIDTSCDESCAAIFDTDSWQLLSDVVHTHISVLQPYGGIVPELASREHLLYLPQVVDTALKNAGLDLEAIEHIAVTNRPGLIGALLVGLNYSKGLAWAQGISFSVEDHIEGHLYSPLLGVNAPAFPWIAAVVSGGHTELFYIPEFSKHVWLGGTLDDAAGEAFDKIGKVLGLGYPAGRKIDEIASQTSAPDSFPVAQVSPYHFSYSGLKTAVQLAIQKNQPLTEEKRNTFATQAQSAILAPLAKEIRRALNAFPGSTAVLTGGVACNSSLRKLLPEAYFPLPKHCTDNAAMMAIVAAMKHKHGLLAKADWNATASARSDWPSMHFESVEA